MNSVYTFAYTHTPTPECFQCVGDKAVALERELVCFIGKESFLLVWNFPRKPLIRSLPFIKGVRCRATHV